MGRREQVPDLQSDAESGRPLGGSQRVGGMQCEARQKLPPVEAGFAVGSVEHIVEVRSVGAPDLHRDATQAHADLRVDLPSGPRHGEVPDGRQSVAAAEGHVAALDRLGGSEDAVPFAADQNPSADEGVTAAPSESRRVPNVG